MGQGEPDQIGQIFETPDLARALGSDSFKQFLDHLPVAIAVSELQPTGTIVYANLEFERLIDTSGQKIVGATWRAMPGQSVDGDDAVSIAQAIAEGSDHLGRFEIEIESGSRSIDVWSNIVQDEDDRDMYRLVALVEARDGGDDQEALEKAIEESDALLRELQHRVKNNLQMITTLIRVESRKMPDDASGERVDRLAGRIESLALLYQSLSDADRDGPVDLGVYLSQIASAVMRAHAVEGIRLDMLVDTWPVSINVAMPTGLVVNEVLTNALKHAFVGRDHGTIRLKSLVDETGCKITISDDGIGLPAGATWPQPGKMGTLMVRSLRQNSRASFEVVSTPEKGTSFEMFFARADAAA